MTTITSYDLFVYESTLVESGGKRSTAWAALIRVDDTGQAYPIRWESLANLTPSTRPGTSLHPARHAAANDEAERVARKTAAEHEKVRADWFSQARRDLRDLPFSLTVNIENREERVSLREHLQAQTEQRLQELEGLSAVTLSPPRLTARLRVHAAAQAQSAEEKDSELVAMMNVQQLLGDEGWQVADVHTDNRGYDLHAQRGRERRLVEVKGVWGSAASNGIRMTGNEVLIATQHKSDYWLYVVDECSGGSGRLFGTYRDPAGLFSDDMRGDAIFRVPGSSLNRANARRPE